MLLEIVLCGGDPPVIVCEQLIHAFEVVQDVRLVVEQALPVLKAQFETLGESAGVLQRLLELPVPLQIGLAPEFQSPKHLAVVGFLELLGEVLESAAIVLGGVEVAQLDKHGLPREPLVARLLPGSVFRPDCCFAGREL